LINSSFFSPDILEMFHLMELKQLEKEKQHQFILYNSMVLILLLVSLAHAGDKKASSSYEEELLSHINDYRLENGLNPLSFDNALNKSAKIQSQHMKLTDTLDHASFHDRYKQCGRSLCVENIGWNFITPDGQFQAWRNSRGHNENMLNKQIKHAGISKIGPYVTFFACD
jgi:uncharacterized protein YkwD